MALSLRQCGSVNMPIDDTSTSGGAIDTSNVITANSIGELFPNFKVDASSDITWYSKVFANNYSALDTWYNVKFYIMNGLIDISTAGVVALQASSSSEDVYVRLVGKNALSTNVEEIVHITGTTVAYSYNSFSKLFRAETLTAGGVKTFPVSNIGITRDVYLGMIPAGINTATNEFSIGLEASLDGTATTTNRLIAPSGISFSKPNTLATSLDCVGSGGDIPAGSAQGIWIKYKVEAGAKTSTDIYLRIRCYGSDAD